MRLMHSRLRLFTAALIVATTTACVANFRNHGYIPPEEVLDAIAVGIDTRATVEDVAGSPASTGVLNDSGFYYVRSRVKTFAYRAPEVVERQVLAVSFDSEGVVTNIERFGLEDGQVITLERRVTDSNVVSGTFLRQLLEGIGRFAPGTEL